MRFADLLPVSDVRDEDAGANNIFHAGPSLLQSRLDVLQRLHGLCVGIANADHLAIRRSGGRAGYMNLCTHAYCARVTHERFPRGSAVERHYAGEIRTRYPQRVNSVSHLLAEFCDAEQLFKIRNAAGNPLGDVGEMLIESNPVFGPAPSFDRERQVRKHIGDYTLFFTGMFPESINHFRLRRERLEGFVDWMKAGKESYYIVSKFEHFEYAKVAPLFAMLSQHFEQCVYGLNLVKNDLQEMQHPVVRRVDEILM